MLDLEQGSEAWKQARLGKVSASRIADMIAKTKTGWGASRANYRAQLIAERLTGCPAESYSNAAMAWGTETEPEARTVYELLKGVTVDQVGCVIHPTITDALASPDGLVGDDGLVEIKCPNTATHIETLLGGEVPGKYVLQMQFQMACTGRKWCDFVSFDPRMPGDMQTWISRVHRDDAMIEMIETEARAFLREVSDTIDQLTAKYRAEAA
ncbi:MAG: lambda exonuclease family protein [Hyphomonadaceae bacterium]